jgi:hypothetical protein
MLTVKCPKCLHDQLYDPKINEKTPTVVGKKKRCVYCGTSFSIHSDQLKTRIVAIGKAVRFNQGFS